MKYANYLKCFSSILSLLGAIDGIVTHNYAHACFTILSGLTVFIWTDSVTRDKKS